MKVTRLKTGGFLSSGSDAGDLEILRKSNDYDDGSNMKAGGPVKSKLKKVIKGLQKASKSESKRKVKLMKQVITQSPD